MQSWARSLALTLAFLAAPVAATPPQIVWVEDSLFGITDREVLILRTINDNHGYHQTHQTDTFLIIRDLATGRDIDQVAVERVVANTVEGPETTHYPLDRAANPYAIRAALNAAPLANPRRMYLDVVVRDDAIRALHHDGADTHFAHWADIIPLAATSLQRSRELLPVLRTEGGVDPFDPSGLLQPANCDIAAALRTWYRADVDVMLVQLDCEDVDVGGSNLIWVVVPPV